MSSCLQNDRVQSVDDTAESIAQRAKLAEVADKAKAAAEVQKMKVKRLLQHVAASNKRSEDELHSLLVQVCCCCCCCCLHHYNYCSITIAV